MPDSEHTIAARPPWSEREPAAWLLRLGSWVATAVGLVGVAALFLGFARASRMAWDAPWQGFVMGVIAIQVVVALHELGHFIGGRATGMHVMRAHVGWLDLKAMRLGWKARWAAPSWSVDGAVMAFLRSGRPVRPQMFWMIFGGPLANLLTAAVAGLVGWASWGSALGWGMAGFAAYSLAVGVVNLVPGKRPMATDGLQLWRLAKGMDEHDPAVALSMVNGLCLEGVTADQLPADLLERVRNQAKPPALVLDWFAIFAALHRGDWAQVAAFGPRIDENMAAVPAHERAVWAALTSVMRTLVAISEAMATGKVDQPLDRHLMPDYDWTQPSLRMLCRALESGLAGDATARDAWLGRAAFEGERSFDAASRETQRRLRAAIGSRLGEPADVSLRPMPGHAATPSRGVSPARLAWGASAVIHALTVGVCLLALMVGSVFATGLGMGKSLLGVGLALLLMVAGSALHVFARYVAARLAGLPVSGIAIGPFELRARRQGWRRRWRHPARWLLGHVDVGLAPGRPERRSLLVLALGGVMVSGATAVLFLMLAMRHIPDAWGWLWLGLAGHALALSLGNLVPGPGRNNAGAQLMRLAWPSPTAKLELARMRVQGWISMGPTAEAWPGETLSALESLPAPGPLLAIWLELSSAICRGAWAEADRVGAGLPALVSRPDARTKDPDAAHLQASFQSLWSLAKALHQGRAEVPLATAITPELEWRTPWLKPLCLAMDAALAGDMEANVRELARSQAMAAEDPDQYQRRIQESLCKGIEAFASAPTPRAPPA